MYNFKNSKKQGDSGMGAAIAYFTSLGKTVCIPLTDSQGYDIIIETSAGKLKKVQVKTTTYKGKYGNFRVSLKTCGGNQKVYTAKLFDKSKIDYLFVLTSDNTCYLIPTKYLEATSEITLGLKYKRFKLS